MKPKKIIGLLLAVVLMVFPAGPGLVKTEAETAQSSESYTELLTMLSIFGADTDWEEEITKGEFAQVVIRMLHPDQDFQISSGTVSSFLDVPPSHAHYSAIMALTSIQAIKGNSSGQFHPDEKVTGLECAVILLNALGYTPYVKGAGGYPSGYYQMASKTGISRGVSLSEMSTVTNQQAAKLVFQAMKADLVVMDSVSGDEPSVRIDSTRNLLSQRFLVEEYDCVVWDNGYTALSGSSSGEGERVVLRQQESGAQLTVYDEAGGVDGLLGSRIRAFVKNNRTTGRSELIYYTVHSAQKEILINGRTIVEVTESYVAYEEGERILKKPFSFSRVAVILNGIHVTHTSPELLRVKDGFVRLIDYDGNGITDVIDILDFAYVGGIKTSFGRNIVVNSIDVEEQILSDGLNPTQVLDLSSERALFRIIGEKGIRSLSDLSLQDVVSVAEATETINGKLFYTLVVSRASVSARIEALGAEEVFTDQGNYLVAGSYLSVRSAAFSSLKGKETVTMLLDATGKVAHLTGTSTSKEYAYLIQAAVKRGADEVLTVKLLNKYGKIVTYEVDSKAKIDGETYANATAQLQALKLRPDGAVVDSVKRPVIHQIDREDRITLLDTDTPNPTYGIGTDENFYTWQYYIKYTDREIADPEALKAGYRSPRISKYKAGLRTFDGKFYLTADTVIMGVPDIDLHKINAYQETISDKSSYNTYAFSTPLIQLYEEELNDENYRLMSLTELNALMMYDIQAYDIDPETGIAGLAVVRGRKDAYSYGSVSAALAMSIVLRVGEYYDDARQATVMKLYYTKDGSREFSVLADPDSMLFAYRWLLRGTDDSNPFRLSVKPIRTGDVIRFTEAEGYITHLERVFSIGEIQNSISCGYFPSNSRTLYSPKMAGGIGELTGVPFDSRNGYYAGLLNSYSVNCVYPRSITGNRLSILMGFGKLSAINPEKLSTYANLMVEGGGVFVGVIDVSPDGKIKVRSGELSDIVTYEKTGDLTQSSILLFKQVNMKLEQLFVINGAKYL